MFSSSSENQEENDSLEERHDDYREYDCEDTRKKENYQKLIHQGYFLPKFSSTAITAKVFEKKSDSRYLFLLATEIQKSTISKPKLTFNLSATWFMIQRIAHTKFRKIFPFETTPNKSFVVGVLGYVDLFNEYNLFEVKRKSLENHFLASIVSCINKRDNLTKKENINKMEHDCLIDELATLKNSSKNLDIRLANTEFSKLEAFLNQDKVEFKDLFCFEFDISNYRYDEYLLFKKQTQVDLSKIDRHSKFFTKNNEDFKNLDLFKIYSETERISFYEWLQENNKNEISEEQKAQLERIKECEHNITNALKQEILERLDMIRGETTNERELIEAATDFDTLKAYQRDIEAKYEIAKHNKEPNDLIKFMEETTPTLIKSVKPKLFGDEDKESKSRKSNATGKFSFRKK